MLPHRWKKSTLIPYSSESPLPERFIRHARESETQRQWVILTTIAALTCLPLLVIVMDEYVGTLGILLPLLTAWTVAIMTILSTAIVAALMTGEERRSSQYELLWLTDLSDQALGSSFLFATLYRMRTWIIITLAMIPTLIFGMIRIEAWAIERCQPSFYFDGCDPLSTYEIGPYSSTLMGIFVCISIIGMLPLGTTCAVGLALRWQNPIFAAGTTVVTMIFTIALVILLSINTLAPPPEKVSIWSGLMMLILSNIGLTALVLFATVRRFKDGLEILFILNALLTMVAVIAFGLAPGSVRISVLSMVSIVAIPYGLLVIALNFYWRSARHAIQ